MVYEALGNLPRMLYMCKNFEDWKKFYELSLIISHTFTDL